MKTRNELALIARTHAREALRVLVEIMNSKDASPTARAAAAKVLRRHLKVIGGFDVRRLEQPCYEFTEKVRSGRPGFKAMLDRIAGNGVRVILVESPDRFARDLSVQITGHDYLRSLGVELVPTSAPDFFTTDTPTAVLVRQVLGAVSQFEKANLIAKLRAARERKIAAGGRGSGRFAYAQKVPEVVALVRELHGQRQSLRQISKTLAAQGHLTGGGRRERGARDQGEAACPVVPVAREKPHARRIAAHEHSEAVVFDLVQPPNPSGRLGGWAGKAWLAKVGEGYATQQHDGGINSAGRGRVESDLPHENQDAFRLPCGRLGSLVRPRHLDRYAFPHARPEMACRYRTGRVALRETARLKIVPQVREEGKRPPARQGAAMAASPCGRARGSCMRADNQSATRAPLHSITSSARAITSSARASSVGGRQLQRGESLTAAANT
jgi:DNA invertase Pin-like site-specific DNA recombinase